MGVLKTNDYIQIQVKMPNQNQEPPAFSKAPNEDWKDRDVLYTFKIHENGQNLLYEWNKDYRLYPDQEQDSELQTGTSSILQSSNQDLKDMEVLWSKVNTDS